jgi:hypothetical protein
MNRRRTWGWLGALVAVGAGCGGGSSLNNTGSTATVDSCNTYCSTVIAKNCDLPVYATIDQCKQMACSRLPNAPAACQPALKTYFDCEANQPDICGDSGCTNELHATQTCGSTDGGSDAGPVTGAGGTTTGAGGAGTGGIGAGGAAGINAGGAGGGAGGFFGAGGAGGAGGGGGGSGGAGPWSPSVLGARLVLWLDASQETTYTDGARMLTWSDRSSAGNNAAQPTTVSRPTFEATGINGLPSVAFDGSLTFFQIADAPSLRWGTQDFAIMVVARGNGNANGNTMLYQKSDLNSPYAGPTLYLNSQKPVPSNDAAVQLDGVNYIDSVDAYSDGVAHLYGGRLTVTGTSETLELRVDGVRQSSLAVTPLVDEDAAGQPAIIGHNGYTPSPGFQAFKGDIAEVVAIKGTLTANELQSLEIYLIGKYALP